MNMDMSSVDIPAIAWGLAVGIGLSFIVGTLLAVITGISIAAGDDVDAPGMDEEEFARYYLENISDTHFMFGIVVISLLINVLAGYVTARMAHSGAYLNSAIMALLVLAFSLYLELRRPVLPRWALWLFIIASIPAALFGAYGAGA